MLICESPREKSSREVIHFAKGFLILTVRKALTQMEF